MTTARLILPVAVLALVSAACETGKSANPLSPDLAGPLAGVEITAPKTLEPVNGQQILSDSGPPSLLIENAGTSGPRPLYLQVELATDATFQQRLHHADRVEPGEGGRTTYRLPEPLGPGHTYFWRVRAADGANTGPYSAPAHFAVVEPVIIKPPTPIEPVGTIATNRPNFVVRNGEVAGPAGDVVYRFEVGTSDSAPPAAVVSATPGPGGTTTITLGDLPFERTLFWRVHATNGAVDSYSGIVSFRTPNRPAPPPPPPGGGGGGGGGGGVIPGGGGGRRTPDPAPGQRLALPNMSRVVQQVAAARPDLLRNSCQEHGGTWGFMDLLVDTLRTYDTRWGYNWKRGNVGDPSLDVIAYHYGAGRDEGSTNVYIIDVIASHCGSNPSPSWGDMTEATRQGGSIGRWTGRGRF